MLELQKFLIAGGTLEKLTALFGIKNSRHKTYPNLVLFKYSQIESPMGETIVQESRGIILDESDNWRVVGRGFSKFFNHGEGHAAAIDWTTARVQEKVDGSLIQLYEYNGQWQVATTGSADASGDVFGFGFTFADLFNKTFLQQALAFPDVSANTDTCFLFELCTPYNRVVVPHKESKVVLLTARNRVTGQYLSHPEIPGIPNVAEFPLTSFEEIAASFAHIDGLNQEGYVVVDAAGNRVKVKHPQYVALHHLRDSVGPKWLAKVVVSGEVPELLTAFPEYADQLNALREKYEAFVAQVEAEYATMHGIETQKEFALRVKDGPFAAILFALRAGKAGSVREWMADEKSFDKVMRLLGVKDIEVAEIERNEDV